MGITIDCVCLDATKLIDTFVLYVRGRINQINKCLDLNLDLNFVIYDGPTDQHVIDCFYLFEYYSI